MRTIKRYSLAINQGKWNQLREIARLYRSEKNLHLKYYNFDSHYITDKSNIDQQMRLVKEKFGTVQKDLKMTHSTFTNYATYRCTVNTHKTRQAG
jgi:hypothetical protein